MKKLQMKKILKMKNIEENDEELETTSSFDIDNFNQWARSQATKDLSHFKQLTNICDLEEFRSKVSSLNVQQRRLFDDVVERVASEDFEDNPFYLFLSGNAGTGKSYLLKLMIEAVKLIKMKPGADLTKPPTLVMAPTANAAFIIEGKTIDSVLGFLPSDGNSYTRPSEARMANMKYSYEDVSILFLDEVSMVGSSKLLKINYRLQDISVSTNYKEYMGGKSLVASGKFMFFNCTLFNF